MATSLINYQAVLAIIPRVQLALCESFQLPNESTEGINILLGAAEGEIVQDAPEVQQVLREKVNTPSKWGLYVLVAPTDIIFLEARKALLYH